MQGMWPIEVEDHGIRYSTGGGRGDWSVRRRGKCDGTSDGNQTGVPSGRLKFNKGIKRTA